MRKKEHGGRNSTNEEEAKEPKTEENQGQRECQAAMANSMKYVERSGNTSKHTKVLQQDQFMQKSHKYILHTYLASLVL